MKRIVDCKIHCESCAYFGFVLDSEGYFHSAFKPNSGRYKPKGMLYCKKCDKKTDFTFQRNAYKCSVCKREYCLAEHYYYEFNPIK